jgi:ABC-type multidrug transport system fused ATPase/permease subunit
MDCDSGDILYNNQKIEDIDLECLRRNVHLNLQNNVIFNDTLWNNLTYGVHNKNIMEEDLFRCMKAAGIDFFHKLQNGFQTILGYNGASISVGQAQRIAIARALLLEPRIVIFDEPASSIDPQTEMLLHETFKKLRERSLVIIITHRRSTLKISDRVLYFEKGTVSDITKQKELQDRFFNEIDEKKN